MKNLTVIDAINELIKGTNLAFARNAYNMSEVRDIYNAIEFLGETIKAQQTPAQEAQPKESTSAQSDK
jgi:hypothetical protein